MFQKKKDYETSTDKSLPETELTTSSESKESVRLKQIESLMKSLQHDRCLMLASLLLKEIEKGSSKTQDSSILDVEKETFGSRLRQLKQAMYAANLINHDHL